MEREFLFVGILTMVLGFCLWFAIGYLGFLLIDVFGVAFLIICEIVERSSSTVKKKSGRCLYCGAPVPYGVKICPKCKVEAEKKKVLLYSRQERWLPF